jgi:hypothetical protein
MTKRTTKRRGRPRGSTGQAKTEVVQFRVNSLEKQGFEEAAKIAGLSVSSWIRERIRQICRDELEKNGREVPFLRREI